MFKKRKCDNCEEKIDKDFNFCPHCSAPLNEELDGEDRGLLGKTDSVEELHLPMGFNQLFNSLAQRSAAHTLNRKDH